jgi:hypothetical protein
MKRTRSSLLVAAAAVAAVALFVVLRPGDDEPTAEPNPEPTTPTATTRKQELTVERPATVRIRIDVRNGQVRGGVRRVTVAEGRRIVLTVTSDVADHVHLHGYDVMRDVAPGSPARLAFTASILGTVELELEDSHVLLARITTQQ